MSRRSTIALSLFAALGLALRVAPTRASSPSVTAANSLELRPAEGRFYRGGVPFTGVAEAYHPNDTLAETTSFVDGRRHGIRQRWFSSGQPSYISHYTAGKQHGRSRTWWRNGNLRSESNFEHGVAHGPQRQWYASGAKFKTLQLARGKESGLQQSWRENGKLYNNYEARNGRIYGLKRSKLCFKLDNEYLR